MQARLSKTTINKAKRHGLVLVEYTEPDGRLIVEICRADADGDPADEYLAAYAMGSRGWSWVGTCSSGDLDCPAHVESEQALRDMLPEFASLDF